ncbi:interleukin-1 receptor antagonist protein-like [Carettochelys insculpta]|uniref:interleukin-1 receptor antagonist protein-like n=1 Tax=Carettochelys insculpta TaxID=44489 RepID=UPI003EB7D5D7
MTCSKEIRQLQEAEDAPKLKLLCGHRRSHGHSTQHAHRPARMCQSSFYDFSPSSFRKDHPPSAHASHRKAVDDVSTVIVREAAEEPREEARWRMNRLTRSVTDVDLMRALSRTLVEDPVSFSNSSFTLAETLIYRYTRSKQYTIRDEAHKSLVLRRHAGQAQLVAMYLQGPQTREEVKLNLDLYRSPYNTPKRLNPVAMNLVESNSVENSLYLCCVMAGGNPMLQVEKVKGPMKEIRSGDLERFIFFRNNSGSVTSFESAAHPGWFLSTLKANNKTVQVVNQTGAQDITDFYVVEILSSNLRLSV